jgi:outer membrane protein assembly factor BamD
MLRVRLLLAGLVAIIFATSIASAELVWRPGEGWSDESGGDVSASSSRDQLDLAHKLEAQGDRDKALKAYKGLLRRWPLSFFAPEAQFRVGKILEDEADFYNAFQSFQRMVQKYPSSTYFEQALGEQYRIANLYLAGEPQRIWKIPVGPSMQRTIEMYQRIIKNAPYGDYAPQCQFNIGLADEKQRKFTDAVDSYQLVLDNYPTSSVASDAQYQIGYAWMKSSISGDYDMGAAKKAVDAFQDYLVRYPNSDKAVQAQENIRSTRRAPHSSTIMRCCAKTRPPSRPRSPRSASPICARWSRRCPAASVLMAQVTQPFRRLCKNFPARPASRTMAARCPRERRVRARPMPRCRPTRRRPTPRRKRRAPVRCPATPTRR